MILDSLKNASASFSLNPRFKQAFDFIQNNDLAKMEPGKLILDGENLFISLVELEGKKPEVAKMEAHKKYIDIQLVLAGQETMGWTAIENCINETEPYNGEKDIIFYTDKPTSYVTVNPGEFAIFFPEDGHAPAIGSGPIKKAIVKVLV
ncbi:MAG: YhcH/YjgK/YiaL family protein [Bacteroidales bacterium]|nr:YhcH/YjgK/YiaL family protein [Bacteroidales bacterium]